MIGETLWRNFICWVENKPISDVASLLPGQVNFLIFSKVIKLRFVFYMTVKKGPFTNVLKSNANSSKKMFFREELFSFFPEITQFNF